jgi:hypothetical protein
VCLNIRLLFIHSRLHFISFNLFSVPLNSVSSASSTVFTSNITTYMPYTLLSNTIYHIQRQRRRTPSNLPPSSTNLHRAKTTQIQSIVSKWKNFNPEPVVTLDHTICNLPWGDVPCTQTRPAATPTTAFDLHKLGLSPASGRFRCLFISTAEERQAIF